MQILRETEEIPIRSSSLFIKHVKLNFNIFLLIKSNELRWKTARRAREEHKKFSQLFVSFTIFCSNGFSVESGRPIE
jgi:hypothetical protein